MDSLFSFPVGLFHPLQHAGLARRTPDGPSSDNNPESEPQAPIDKPIPDHTRVIGTATSPIRQRLGGQVDSLTLRRLLGAIP